MIRFITLVAVIVGVAACAPSIMLSTQRDWAYALDKDVPLFLELKGDVSVYEKNLHTQIKSALTQSGFRVADQLAEAKVVMTFSIADKKELYQMHDPWPPYYYWGPRRHYSLFWPSYYTERTYVKEVRSIKLRLFDAKVYRAGDRVPLWEGVVSGDSNTLQTRLQETVDALVGKIGEDFQGQVQIK